MMDKLFSRATFCNYYVFCLLVCLFVVVGFFFFLGRIWTMYTTHTHTQKKMLFLRSHLYFLFSLDKLTMVNRYLPPCHTSIAILFRSCPPIEPRCSDSPWVSFSSGQSSFKCYWTRFPLLLIGCCIGGLWLYKCLQVTYAML